jgi:hypothetical protein
MILVRRRANASAENPDMIAPTTAPIRSEPTNACCSNLVACSALLMNGSAPEITPVS